MERRLRRHARAAQPARGGLDADRRAEVPLLYPPELAAEREGLRLHAPARPQRRAVVASPGSRRALQLPVFGEGAEADRRDGGGDGADRQEGVSLPQQPLRLEGRGQRGDAQAPHESADRGHVHAGDRRALSGAARAGPGRPGHGFTVTLLITSPTRSCETTSMPLITRPKTAYFPF